MFLCVLPCLSELKTVNLSLSLSALCAPKSEKLHVCKKTHFLGHSRSVLYLSLHKMLRCGVVWIIVMFLSAVWTLILTAPIHC